MVLYQRWPVHLEPTGLTFLIGNQSTDKGHANAHTNAARFLTNILAIATLTLTHGCSRTNECSSLGADPERDASPCSCWPSNVLLQECDPKPLIQLLTGLFSGLFTHQRRRGGPRAWTSVSAPQIRRRCGPHCGVTTRIATACSLSPVLVPRQC